LFKLCPDETGSTAGVRAQAETLNATWEQIPKTSIEMKNNYDMTDVFRSYTNENPIIKNHGAVDETSKT